MQYLLLIYANEKSQAGVPPEEQKQMMARWFEYTEELKRAGAYVGGNALQPIATATSVRVPAGKRIVVDGPFAETKEQLGGYYLVDVENLDAAIEWAARCPGSAFGTIEVRPIMVFE